MCGPTGFSHWRSLRFAAATTLFLPVLLLTHGAPSPTDPDPEGLPLELLALSPWQTTAEITLRGGYRDNVLLSHAHAAGSPFVGAAAEGVAARTFDNGTALELFGMVDYRYFTDSSDVTDETLAFAMTQWRTRTDAPWSASATLDYLFLDQVVDVSANEPQLSTVAVLGHVPSARLGVRHALGTHAGLEALLSGQRNVYDDPLDDSWTTGPRLILGWKPYPRTEWSLTYAPEYTWYDTESARTASGTVLTGTRRTQLRHEAKLFWRQDWSANRRWRTIARLTGGVTRDHQDGYFDYTRLGGSVTLRYTLDRLELEATPRFAFFDYVRQSGDDPAQSRQRGEVAAELKARFRIHRRLHATADYQFERTLSNLAGEEYPVHTVSAGLQFAF